MISHLGSDRATRRGEREGDVDFAALDLDLVDQPELDEVGSRRRVDDVGKGVLYVFHGRHGAHVSSLTPVVLLALAVLFIAVPIAELFVIIWVGGPALGAPLTI